MAKKNSGAVTVEEIKKAIRNSVPVSLSAPGRHPRPFDHVENTIQLVDWGQTRLAADHLLFPEMDGLLPDVMSGVLRRLNLKFARAALSPSDNAAAREQKILARFYCYEYLIETSLNFFGHESACLDELEKELSLEHIYETLEVFEEAEIDETGGVLIGRAAIDSILDGMKLVQGGASMVAKSAGRIAAAMMDSGAVTVSFLEAAQDEIQTNIYFCMVEMDYCKFGNDYALGLRWLRHLGFEQVSTNPVLAAKAYEDDPSLEAAFKREVVKSPSYAEWAADPDKYADEITLCATLFALWDNLHVYRPVFYNLADSTGGGVVSFQLNPNIAHMAKESIADALNALELGQEDLKVYDAYLLAGYQDYADRGRPNMVIKVAASHPAARTIAREINALGLGSNITVIYTVAQQCVMVLEELDGMALAMKRGVVPTQLYMTNMGGRLESHLREVVLENMFAKLKKKAGEKAALAKLTGLAKDNGSLEKIRAAEKFEDKVRIAVSYAYQKTIDANIIKALKDVASKAELELWEDDIAKSGTLVARRTWHIFFSEKNREKWIEWLCIEYSLDPGQADLIMSRINYLPASKRKPQDTFWTLTSSNMVHTEFGNHQENVQQMAGGADFDLLDYVESIRDSFDPDVVKRLNRLADFTTAYEINAEIAKTLKQVGISGEFGSRGHKPEKWGEFGSVMKTSGEFRKAYDNFSRYILGIFPR